jgi:hypothetical protein
VQVPFEPGVRAYPFTTSAVWPETYSLVSAEGGLIADLVRRQGQIEASVLKFDPTVKLQIQAGDRQIPVEGPSPVIVPIELPMP